MSAKSVEKFLNSSIRSLVASGAITKTQGTYLSYNFFPLLGWKMTWDEIVKIETNTQATKKEVAELKNRCLDSTIKEWLKTENYSTYYGSRKYVTEVTDSIGKMFLNNGFGYLCWWRIEKAHRKSIYAQAVRDIGKDFVLSLPIEALIINRTEESNIWVEVRGWDNDRVYGNVLIRDIVSLSYSRSSTFESSTRILQEAGFTKKDGTIFDLDLKIESEADMLRAKHSKLNQRTAKLFLEIAKAEGWVK